MPQLDFITVRGFKSIGAVENLRLTAINVIVGPNGSGKSNLIDVFSFLHAIREGHLQEYVGKAGGAERILHFGSKATPSLQINISFNEGVNQYRIYLQPTAQDSLIPTDETIYFWDKSRYPDPYGSSLHRRGNEAGISDPKVEKIASYVRRHLAKWRLYHFHDTSPASPVKKTVNIDDNGFLREDASNLSAFLYLLKHKYEESYELIRKAVQQVAPFFADFRLEPQRLNENLIRLEWAHLGTDAYFDASSFSDGTLRFICLATLLLQPEIFRPSVILIDEPELGLHPFAVTMLASLIRQASNSTQLIISTQSPLLLDHFDPEEVLIADRVNQSTVFTRLDPAALHDWLDDYSLGQLWEKNEFGGRPGSK